MPTNWVDDRQSTVAYNHFKEDYIPKPKYIIHVGIGDKPLLYAQTTVHLHQ